MRIFIILMLFFTGCATEFDTYYNLDDYNLNFIYEFDKEKITNLEINGVSRFVRTSSDGVTLHLKYNNETIKSYAGMLPEYQAYGLKNGCGPAMLFNLARWYNIPLTIDQSVKDTKMKSYRNEEELYVSCAASCSGELLVCTNICYDFLKNKNKAAGVWVDDAFKAVEKHTPNGYVFQYTEEDPYMIVDIINQLIKGNPVVIHEYFEKHDSLHLSLLTGIEISENNELNVVMVNSYKRPLEEFMEAWSCDNIGSNLLKRNFKRFSGVKPFMAAWYKKE